MAKAKNIASGLTSDELIVIMRDAVLGRPSKLQTPAAKAYRTHADEFVAKATADGKVVDIPTEYGDLTEEPDGGPPAHQDNEPLSPEAATEVSKMLEEAAVLVEKALGESSAVTGGFLVHPDIAHKPTWKCQKCGHPTGPALAKCQACGQILCSKGDVCVCPQCRRTANAAEHGAFPTCETCKCSMEKAYDGNGGSAPESWPDVQLTDVAKNLKANIWIDKADQRLVGGLVYETYPTHDGQQTDGQGDCVTDPEEVRKAMMTWAKAGHLCKVMHEGRPAKVVPIECFFAESDTTKDGHLVPKGSWYLSMYIPDDEIWEAVKAGKLTGFSMAGSAAAVMHKSE